MRCPRFCRLAGSITATLVLVAGSQAGAQLALPGLDGATGSPFAVPSVALAAQFTAPTANEPARLIITAEIPPSFHIYSIDQPPGGPQRTVIVLDPSQQFELAGPFQARPPPARHVDTQTWVGLEIQEHQGRVTWLAPLRFPPGVDFGALRIAGRIETQLCDARRCVPLQVPFTAALGPGVEVNPGPPPTQAPSDPSLRPPQGPTSAGQFRAPDAAVAIRGHLEPATVRPGGQVSVVLTAEPDRGWHVYALADRDPQQISKPTLIVIDQPAGMQAWRATTQAQVVEENRQDIGLGIQRYYEGQVTWNVRLEVPPDTPPGDYPLGGLIGYQVCQATGCKPPAALRFDATIRVGNRTAAGRVPLVFTQADYGDVARRAAAQPVPPAADDLPHRSPTGSHSLAAILLFALAGGLILNLMPCVLPVIGLKILSFFEQAGQRRAHVLALNLWYSAGLLLVFLALATLAVSVQLGIGSKNYGWGELYTLTWFKVLMTALVFTMALSFLGVWEIPIPGFTGTGKATQLATQEGATGAFFKGVLTTILATPCSGPFLGPVFGFTLGQTPLTTYLVFASVGVGMASPYLLIGAFPNLIRFLPRPGAWMETFKQLLGFLLLGTVVYLFSTMSEKYFLATLTLLVALWFACWWIGRTPLTAGLGRRAIAWIGGSATAGLVGWAAFTALVPSAYELPWRPYSPEALARAQSQGKTVLVDFTANWCPTCKVNSKTAINTKTVKELVEANGVVPLLADWTDRSETIKQALAELNSISIPLLAIYPAGRPDEVIVLPDLLVERQVIEALQRAGPSRPATGQSSVQRPMARR